MIDFNSNEERLYFEWLCQKVKARRSYSFLMFQLYNTEFYYTLDLDVNRLKDGFYLRDLYIYEKGLCAPQVTVWLHTMEQISVLEVLVAMAIRFEENIMCDDYYGDRTDVWFWMMIDNLEINLSNSKYNEDYISWMLAKFMSRDYDEDGTGSIVRLENDYGTDIRDIEIWHQFNLYLSELTERSVL